MTKVSEPLAPRSGPCGYRALDAPTSLSRVEEGADGPSPKPSSGQARAPDQPLPPASPASGPAAKPTGCGPDVAYCLFISLCLTTAWLIHLSLPSQPPPESDVIEAAFRGMVLIVFAAVAPLTAPVTGSLMARLLERPFTASVEAATARVSVKTDRADGAAADARRIGAPRDLEAE